MCLYFNLKTDKMLENLRKRVGVNGWVTLYKTFMISTFVSKKLGIKVGKIITPYQYDSIVLDKDGYFYSDKTSNIWESGNEIKHGIHAYRGSYPSAKGYCEFKIPIKCQVKDIIKFGTKKEVVCYKVKIDKQLLLKEAKKFAKNYNNTLCKTDYIFDKCPEKVYI